MSTALEEAVARLKAQQRATAARADASERLSGEIISSLTAGLLVVGLNGEFRILNPAGRRMLNIPESLAPADYRRTAHEQPLLDVVDECLKTGMAIVRRPVALPEDTAHGALGRYIARSDPKHYQPTNIAFGLLPELAERVRDKAKKRLALAERALASLERFKAALAQAA